jgi:hypothetical protein
MPPTREHLTVILRTRAIDHFLKVSERGDHRKFSRKGAIAHIHTASLILDESDIYF